MNENKKIIVALIDEDTDDYYGFIEVEESDEFFRDLDRAKEKWINQIGTISNKYYKEELIAEMLNELSEKYEIKDADIEYYVV